MLFSLFPQCSKIFFQKRKASTFVCVCRREWGWRACGKRQDTQSVLSGSGSSCLNRAKCTCFERTPGAVKVLLWLNFLQRNLSQSCLHSTNSLPWDRSYTHTLNSQRLLLSPTPAFLHNPFLWFISSTTSTVFLLSLFLFSENGLERYFHFTPVDKRIPRALLKISGISEKFRKRPSVSILWWFGVLFCLCSERLSRLGKFYCVVWANLLSFIDC